MLELAVLYGGPDNAGVPMILEEGTTWNKTDLAHNDQLQLQQLSEFYVTDVARYFNISPVKLHQLGRATWGNLETLNREHVTSCLGPWLARHEAEVGVKLLRTDRTGRVCRHNLDRLLQADTATRFAAWASARRRLDDAERGARPRRPGARARRRRAAPPAEPGAGGVAGDAAGHETTRREPDRCPRPRRRVSPVPPPPACNPPKTAARWPGTRPCGTRPPKSTSGASASRK